MSNPNHPDVIVIGAGPAGLMAGGQAASRGARVLILEKMEETGRKLRITGMGRCNITNIAPMESFITHFGRNGRFLRQAFSQFFNQDLIQFMDAIGIKTAAERGGRVFPSEVDAPAVSSKLTTWAEKSGAEIITGAPVRKILVENGAVTGVERKDGAVTFCHRIILATGGASYTGTGSTGDGFRMAQELGHAIAPIRPALVPLKTHGQVAQKLQGLPLRNIRVSLYINGKKKNEAFGELLFTHFGVSGPLMLTLSGQIVDALADGAQVEIHIDLKPALDEAVLDARLLRELDAHGKQQFITMLKRLLPLKMAPVCADLTGIPPAKPCHQITSVERAALLRWLKNFRLEISGHLPLEAAMVTAGGIALGEVNPCTMESRLVEGLYFAGETLDLAADTGGYNLQEAFSTGWVAGQSAANCE